MKIQSSILLNDLKEKTLKMIHQVESFQQMPENELNRQPEENKWSILECVEHLNLYSDFYIEEFKSRISSAKHVASEFHKPGLIGNHSAKSMLPVGDKIPMKMKTFKHMNPIRSNLSISTLDKFIQQQTEFIELINQAQNVHLTKTKCSLTIKGFKFRLGDALRFYAFHNIRHIVQATRVTGKNFEF